jgi:2-keto-4-pentenoate hydratase/2-oxohepta-3-ene-1,7-dioic acid hydratase in catechol pathway
MTIPPSADQLLLQLFLSAPILFYKPATAIIGPNAPITIPGAAQPVSKHIPDYEVELTVVIGKAAKDVPEEDALDYVLGYTAANDVSESHSEMQHFDVRTGNVGVFPLSSDECFAVGLFKRFW